MRNKFKFCFLTICFCLIGNLMAFAQTKQIQGTVTDNQGEALIGASVSVQGESSGTVTDSDGKFSLSAKTGDVLSISYLGYVTQTVKVGEQQTVYTVILQDNESLLNEVVVVGYGTLEKRQVTNSITSISAKELPVGVGGATIGNALSGKVSSLVIQETPSPNTETTLQLRGMASVNSSMGPLVVIDGMPGGDIRSIVQEDILSIDVLKDASASAIYGTRATGGVILITTKQAQEGKMRLSYTGEVIFKNTFGKPRVMTADEYRQYKGTNYDYGGSYDWYDAALSDNPTSQRHVVSFNGGSRDAKIFATTMFEDNRGTMYGDNRKDFSGRLNGAFKFLDGWLDVTTHLSYRRANRDQATVGTPIFMNPTRSPYAGYPSEDWKYTESPTANRNPLYDAKNISDDAVDTWFRPDVDLRINILPIEGLSYNQTFGYEDQRWKHYRYEPSYIQRGEYVNRSGLGTALIEYSETELMSVDGYFSFVRKFGDVHKINASLGYSYFEKNAESASMKNYGFDFDAVGVWNIGSGSYFNNPNVSDPKPEMKSHKNITERLMAYFGRVNYSFMDRYIASATLRHEGSSKFAQNNRWGDFWQLSAAWRLSEENFMQNVEPVNDLKLRVAYGVTGNEGFNANYGAVTYTPSETRTMLPDGSWVSSYGTTYDINPYLGWEEKHEWNIGLDYELFNSRLFGKVDFFRRKVDGLMYETHNSKGEHGLWWENIGTLENTGWEFEIGGKIIDTRDWKYSSKINISHNNTKVGKMDGTSSKMYGGYTGRAGNVHCLEEGVTVGSFLLYKFSRIDEDGNFVALLKDGTEKVLDGGIDASEMQYMGNYVPAAVIGWTHDLQYKNWSLQMQINSAIDFDIYNGFEHTNGLVSGNAGSEQNLLLVAYTKNKQITGAGQATDYFLEDGTYIKIQNVSLGYNLDMKKYTPLIQSGKVYFTINNALRISKYSGLNPEIDFTGWAGGIDNQTLVYPQTRTFALGIQLNF